MEEESQTTQILIATASFGEGHNSAARGLKHALGGSSVAQIVDPCALAAPRLNEKINTAYRRLTNHSPYIWKGIYNACDKRDFSKERLPVMKRARAKLGQLIEEREVEALLSTYFIYPYFLERHVKRQGRRIPVFSVVTDSIEINAAWFKAPCDHWFVTDQFTRQKLIRFGLPPKVVHDYGFPIHPKFTQLTPLPINAPIEPFRVLFFPTVKRPHVKRTIIAILRADARTTVTIVLGKNVRQLYKPVREIQELYPNRIHILGWSQRVPQLLTTHHIIVGKAGGATVHEAIAANCPMLIHHIVPGQEEGNLALLQANQCGEYVSSATSLSDAIQTLLSNNAAVWRVQKENMKKITKPFAAKEITDFVLNHIK